MNNRTAIEQYATLTPLLLEPHFARQPYGKELHRPRLLLPDYGQSGIREKQGKEPAHCLGKVTRGTMFHQS